MPGSKEECHIRDILATSRTDFKEGKVSSRTLCGLEDPKMNTLTYGDPEMVAKRKVKHPCKQCIEFWVSEVNSISDYKKAQAKFREMVGRVSKLGYVTRRGYR